MTIGGMPVPILSAGPSMDVPWNDRVTVRLGSELRGWERTDVILTIEGRTANALRLNVQ